MELDKLVNDIFNAILKYNKRDDRDAVPHSDLFLKDMTSQFGVNEGFLNDVITLLRDSHKIFVFEITKEDKNRNVNRVQGFVDADITTVRRLKLLFQDLLVTLYEDEYGRKMMAHQAIAELFPELPV